MTVLQELLQRLGIEGLLANVCILEIMKQVAHNRRPRQVEFYTSHRLTHDVYAKRLHIALRTEFCRRMLQSSKCFLAICFHMPFSEEILKVVLRVTSRLSIYFVHRSQIFSFLYFLCQAELFTTVHHSFVNESPM